MSDQSTKTFEIDDSCSDCPFANWSAGECALRNAMAGANVRTEIDDEALPEECPLKEHVVLVKLSPDALETNRSD